MVGLVKYEKWDVARLFGLGLVYALLARIVLTYTLSNGNVTIFWIPGGVALAALLIWGNRLWPAIFFGAVMAGLMVDDPLPVSLCLAAGNTLETVCAAWTLSQFSQFSQFSKDLSEPRHYLLLVIVALCASVISALIGPITLWKAGFLTQETVLNNVLHWWQADTLGIILVTPLLLIWRRCPCNWFKSRQRIFETLVFFALFFVTALVVFFESFDEDVGQLAKDHWMYLFVVWAALRYGRHGVSLIVALIAVLAFEGARRGRGYFADDLALTGLQNFWFYVLMITTVGLFLVLTVSLRQRVERQLRETSEELDSYFNNALDLFCIVDRHGYCLKVNQPWERLLGHPIAELQGARFLDLVHPEDLSDTQAALSRLNQNQSVIGFVNRFRRRDNGYCWIEWNALPKDGKIFAAARDITGRKLVEERLRLAEAVYQHSSEGIMITNADNQIVAVNPAFTELTGYADQEVLGQNPQMLSSGRQDAAFYQALWQQLLASGHWQGEIYNRRKTGEVIAEWMTINSIFDERGRLTQRVALFSDITEKKEKEQIIWNQANYDALTQLPNRRLFGDRLRQEIRKAQRDRLMLGLLFLDLDRFKEVNDTLGHRAGDNLLMEAARRITLCVRETDTVARLGGDEFTVIVSELCEITVLERIAQSILDALSRPFLMDTGYTYVSASVGMALYPNDTENLDDLICYADQAMYAAKEQGRNRYRFFTPKMQEAAWQRMATANDLHRALDNNELMVYYQPIVDLNSGKIHKAEALLRWRHPVRGMVSPAEFIPIAEDTGMIDEIGDWVFGQAAKQVRQWRADFCSDFQISVNKSPLQFRQKQPSAGQWLAVLQENGLDGSSIVVEITEGLLLDTSSQVAECLLAYRDNGVQVAIDDFGTGYSALSYLKKFDIDYLKIDQVFTGNLIEGSSDLALTEAIVVMAHKLGLKVIAEGVETEQQHQLLQQIGCDYGQGYLYAKPIPAQAFSELLTLGAGMIPTRAGFDK